MGIVKFVDNVPGRVAPGTYREIAWELKQRPGEWALVGTGRTTSLASRINQGIISWFLPIGEWEAVTRRTEGGGRETYARYVGGLFEEEDHTSTGTEEK